MKWRNMLCRDRSYRCGMPLEQCRLRIKSELERSEPLRFRLTPALGGRPLVGHDHASGFIVQLNTSGFSRNPTVHVDLKEDEGATQVLIRANLSLCFGYALILIVCGLFVGPPGLFCVLAMVIVFLCFNFHAATRTMDEIEAIIPPQSG